MNILLPVSSFHYLTGAELYVYNLGRELAKRGHRVFVAAHRAEGILAGPAKQAGIEAFRFRNFPRNLTFDLIHSSQELPTRWALTTYPKTPILCTVHSQFLCERPVVDPRIRHYVCIRPEVQFKIVTQDRVPEAKTSVIYNPIDFERFQPNPPRKWRWAKKRVLFCGTMDQLRKRTIFDLISRSRVEDFDLKLLGLKADNYDGYVENLSANVTWSDQTWGVEDYIHECDETAGVLLGRTTIEGWACGKPGWIYDVDLSGRIKSYDLYPPPEDMKKFDSRLVVDELLARYQKVIG